MIRHWKIQAHLPILGALDCLDTDRPYAFPIDGTRLVCKGIHPIPPRASREEQDSCSNPPDFSYKHFPSQEIEQVTVTAASANGQKLLVVKRS
jgi:hypothetical protein